MEDLIKIDNKTLCTSSNITQGCSVHTAASFLLSIITNSSLIHWIKENNIESNNVIYIYIDCALDIENNALISTSLLSHLVINSNVLRSIERTLYISRTNDYAMLGYGNCTPHIDSIEDAINLLPNMSTQSKFVIGESFDANNKTELRGYILPHIDIKTVRNNYNNAYNTDYPTWPFVRLGINLHINYNNKLIWNKQLYNIHTILSHINWSFINFPTSDLHISTLKPETEIIETGMNHDGYISAVNDVLHKMDGGDTGEVEKEVVLKEVPITTDSREKKVDILPDFNTPPSSYKQVDKEVVKEVEVEGSDVKLEKVVLALRKTGECITNIDPAALLLSVVRANLSGKLMRRVRIMTFMCIYIFTRHIHVHGLHSLCICVIRPIMHYYYTVYIM